MSIAQQIENLLNTTEQDKTLEAFQLQYREMIKKGIVIQRKGYNLAGVNVIGDKMPSMQNSDNATMTFHQQYKPNSVI